MRGCTNDDREVFAPHLHDRDGTLDDLAGGDAVHDVLGEGADLPGPGPGSRRRRCFLALHGRSSCLNNCVLYIRRPGLPKYRRLDASRIRYMLRSNNSSLLSAHATTTLLILDEARTTNLLAASMDVFQMGYEDLLNGMKVCSRMATSVRGPRDQGAVINV